MTRPAKPGDIGILIGDYLAGGRNIGKAVKVLSQCCHEDSWEIRFLEPFYALGRRWSESFGLACVPKRHVIVLEDPDRAKQVKDLETLVKKHTAEKYLTGNWNTK